MKSIDAKDAYGLTAKKLNCQFLDFNCQFSVGTSQARPLQREIPVRGRPWGVPTRKAICPSKYLLVKMMGMAVAANTTVANIQSPALCENIKPAVTTEQNKAANEKRPTSVVPTIRTDNNWMQVHNSLVKRAHQGNIDILFLGDSITQGMNLELLRKVFGSRAVNFGIGGDRTQHLLWRLQNGELDIPGPNPKVVLLLIGTNNTIRWGDTFPNSAEEIYQGVELNLKEIRSKLPQSKILLLAILPRDEKPGARLRKAVGNANTLLSKLADKRHIWYADIGPQLLEPDGKISTTVMSDFLHPTYDVGYDRMFKAIKPHVDALLSSKP